MTSRIIATVSTKPDIWIQITIPNEFKAMGHFNIGVSAVIETTQASAQFIEGCNRMDLNIVSSTHSKSTLGISYDKIDDNTKQKIGELKLEKPIEVLFEGFCGSIYKPDQDLQNWLDSIEEMGSL